MISHRTSFIYWYRRPIATIYKAIRVCILIRFCSYKGAVCVRCITRAIVPIDAEQSSKIMERLVEAVLQHNRHHRVLAFMQARKLLIGQQPPCQADRR